VTSDIHVLKRLSILDGKKEIINVDFEDMDEAMEPSEEIQIKHMHMIVFQTLHKTP